jgi:hypothetical protein
LKDGYATIVDKMGCGKFKPYLQRLFHSMEIMLVHEETEFKKIDAKYQYAIFEVRFSIDFSSIEIWYVNVISMKKHYQC